MNTLRLLNLWHQTMAEFDCAQKEGDQKSLQTVIIPSKVHNWSDNTMWYRLYYLIHSI